MYNKSHEKIYGLLLGILMHFEHREEKLKII